MRCWLINNKKKITHFMVHQCECRFCAQIVLYFSNYINDYQSLVQA